MPKKFNPKTFVLTRDYCPLCKGEIHPSVLCRVDFDHQRCPHCKQIFESKGNPIYRTS